MSETQRAQYARENWFGEEIDDHDTTSTGHVELDGTDPAKYIAFQELRKLVDPICQTHLTEQPWNGGRTAELFAWLKADVDVEELPDIEAAVDESNLVDGRGWMLHKEQRAVELTEPEFYCPKDGPRGTGYRQHRHRRRYNPDTGYVNWGETTGTALPEVDESTFMQAVENYLHGREYRVTKESEYLQRARRLFRDQQLDSHSALEVFIRQVRDAED